MHLESAVVAVAVVAGRRDHAEGARLESHDDGCGVDITEVGELRIALHAAGGVNLDGLLSGDPPQDVEVVHRAVAEDAAGACDVLHRRRCRIHRRAADRVQQAERTVVDGTFGCGERGIEATLVTDLHGHAGTRDDVGDPGRSRPPLRRSASRRRWEFRVRRRPASARHGQGSAQRPRLPSMPDESSLSTESAGVTSCFAATAAISSGRSSVIDETVDAVQSAEGVGVECADAAQSDHAEGGHGILRSSWSRSATSSCAGVEPSANAASTVSTCDGGARLPIGWSRSRLVGNG